VHQYCDASKWHVPPGALLSERRVSCLFVNKITSRAVYRLVLVTVYREHLICPAVIGNSWHSEERTVGHQTPGDVSGDCCIAVSLNVLSFIKGISAVTLVRQSTAAITETWTIKCYGAGNLLLWLWFRGPCIRVLDECHAWTFYVEIRPAGNRSGWKMAVECDWNVMAHAQKPDFVFRRNGRVHLNRRGRQFSWLLAAEVCAPALVMLDTPRF